MSSKFLTRSTRQQEGGLTSSLETHLTLVCPLLSLHLRSLRLSTYPSVRSGPAAPDGPNEDGAGQTAHGQRPKEPPLGPSIRTGLEEWWASDI